MEEDFLVRIMKEEDYEAVHDLWMDIEGLGIRSIDDSKEGVIRFLRRNPTTSVVAEDKATGRIIGAILCGHDGRIGTLYHVCVEKEFRRHGVGRSMAVFAMKALQEEQITKVSLIAFRKNGGGNAFWKSVGWTLREDLNYYDFVLNEENITKFNGE